MRSGTLFRCGDLNLYDAPPPFATLSMCVFSTSRSSIAAPAVLDALADQHGQGEGQGNPNKYGGDHDFTPIAISINSSNDPQPVRTLSHSALNSLVLIATTNAWRFFCISVTTTSDLLSAFKFLPVRYASCEVLAILFSVFLGNAFTVCTIEYGMAGCALTPHFRDPVFALGCLVFRCEVEFVSHHKIPNADSDSAKSSAIAFASALYCCSRRDIRETSKRTLASAFSRSFSARRRWSLEYASWYRMHSMGAGLITRLSN